MCYFTHTYIAYACAIYEDTHAHICRRSRELIKIRSELVVEWTRIVKNESEPKEKGDRIRREMYELKRGMRSSGKMEDLSICASEKWTYRKLYSLGDSFIPRSLHSSASMWRILVRIYGIFYAGLINDLIFTCFKHSRAWDSSLPCHSFNNYSFFFYCNRRSPLMGCGVHEGLMENFPLLDFLITLKQLWMPRSFCFRAFTELARNDSYLRKGCFAITGNGCISCF